MLAAAPAPATPPGHDRSAGPDLIVIGVRPASVFNGVGLWDPRAALALLYDLDGPVVMRSAVETEQRVLDSLAPGSG
jgi:hypothetical protein